MADKYPVYLQFTDFEYISCTSQTDNSNKNYVHKLMLCIDQEYFGSRYRKFKSFFIKFIYFIYNIENLFYLL